MDAVKSSDGNQAQPGKMLHSQQCFFSKPSVAARHGETQAAKPYVRAERDAEDARGFGGKRVGDPILIGELGFVRHQICADDQPCRQHAEIAHDAHKTDGEGGMRLQFFLDAAFESARLWNRIASWRRFFLP